MGYIMSFGKLGRFMSHGAHMFLSGPFSYAFKASLCLYSVHNVHSYKPLTENSISNNPFSVYRGVCVLLLPGVMLVPDSGTLLLL